MSIKSVDYIITAKHYARQEGAASVKERILKLRSKIYRERNIAIQIEGIDKPMGAPVYARIWQGAWIADCECRGAEFVDPEEKIFFCFSCANRSNGHRPRPVVFPEDWQEIERLLLERPVDDTAGLTDLERAGMARPLIAIETAGGTAALTRSWRPGETVADLKGQQDAAIRTWKKTLKDGPDGIR